MRQYKRAYQLIIGDEDESIIIDGLDMAFDIKKTITSEPNPAAFTLINLSSNTRNLITSKQYNRVLFNVGYEGGMKTAFIGYIDDVENLKDSTEIHTTLICSDGQKDYRESRVSVTVAKGSTDEEIVKQVLGEMPNTESGVQDYKATRKLPRGKTLVGNSRDVLTQVAKNQDADWSIQDGQLLILPKDKALANNEGFLISEDTGMIGSPQKTSDGLEVKCFLNNSMKVGQLCRVASVLSEYSGDFKITKINMRGSLRSNDWLNVLTLQNGQFGEVKS